MRFALSSPWKNGSPSRGPTRRSSTESWTSTPFPHQRLIEYFEALRDPLRLYFQEKAANLFLKKEVMRVFIEDGNRERTGGPSRDHILSTSFLEFSEVFAKPEAPPELVPTDEDLLNKYANEKAAKRIDCLFMMKVNDEILKKGPSVTATPTDVHERNESLISDSLNSQVENLKARVNQRRLRSFMKGKKSGIGETADLQTLMSEEEGDG